MTTPARSPEWAAVVMAGGESRRMGRGKAGLPHPTTGQSLLAHQATIVAPLLFPDIPLLVSARSGQALPPLPENATRIDDTGSSGPIGGILAIFNAWPLAHLLVVAIDLPYLTTADLFPLLASRRPGRGGCLAGGDRLQPLAALYPREMQPRLAEAQSRGALALTPLIKAEIAAGRWEVVPVSADSPALTNWNTPEDLAGPS